MTKKEAAYSKIRSDIFCRTLSPGTRINISDLAEKYQMSAIPIREALTLLETENLVKNTPYRGYVVTNMAFNDLLEYSLIASELECLALRYAIAYSTEESVAEVKALQAQLREQFNNGEKEQYVITNRRFHVALYSFAPCSILLDMIDDMSKRSYYKQSILLMVPERIRSSLDEHDDIIAAVEARDTERAVHLLFRHRLNTLQSLVQAIQQAIMRPNYQDQELLKTFFMEDQLKNRSAISGEAQYWDYILSRLSGPLSN